MRAATTWPIILFMALFIGSQINLFTSRTIIFNLLKFLICLQFLVLDKTTSLSMWPIRFSVSFGNFSFSVIWNITTVFFASLNKWYKRSPSKVTQKIVATVTDPKFPYSKLESYCYSSAIFFFFLFLIFFWEKALISPSDQEILPINF